MANNSPTIVVGSLNDEELKKSIDKLVANVDEGLNKMLQSTKNAVSEMNKTLKSLGDTKIDFGGAADGGSNRRTKAQNAETKAVNDTTAAYDKQAQALQRASGGSKNIDVVQTMQVQLDLMMERLREARSQYSSFVALAASATTTGDKGLFQFAADGVHRYEQEVHNLIPQIRGMRSAISQMGEVLAPQGHAFENYVKSIQKANPELALLNQQYKNGNALLQQRGSTLRNTADDERRIAEESRNRIQRENAYAATAAARENKRREDIWKTAEAARELSKELIRGMSTGKIDISSQSYAKLNEYYEQMRQVYYNFLPNEVKESPFGQALKNDIDMVEKALVAIRGYSSAFRQMQAEASKTSGEGSVPTLERLRERLKTLAEAYSKLTVEEINAGKDKGIVSKYQRISREVEILQRRLSTPISFDAVKGIQVKTLDDMVYKLRQLNAYKQSIDLTKPDADRKIREVDVEIVRLKKDIDKYASSTKIAEQQTNALTRSLNYMKNRLAFYFTVGASTAFVKNLIDIRAQYEMNERALGILINSAERGSQIFKELSDMALVSPYTLIELSTAAKQLTAYDVAAKDVVDTTRRLADMTAAVGIPIERLTYAIGQVKAYGYLNARDARMFSNVGIPLVKELGDYYTQLEGRLVSVSDVYDKIKKKAIDYNAVMSVVTKMTDEGGKFFDFQAKMADTLKVQLANLTLAWNNMLNDLGSDSQGMLSSLIKGLKELFLHWKDIDHIIHVLLISFGLWKTAQLTALAFTGQLTGAMTMQILVGEKLQAKMSALASGMKAASIGISAAGAAFWLVLADGIMTYRRNAEEIEQLNKSIADGAKESAESLGKFLESTEIYRNRLSAATGKLPKSDAEKTWEALREQIELSSASAKDIIPRLFIIRDINERLTFAFDLAERIKDANEKLGDLMGNLDVSQDTILGGILGEGLAEDLEDYNEKIEYTAKKSEWAASKSRSFFDNAVMGLVGLFNEVKNDLGSDEIEAEKEIRKFAATAAQTIEEELGEEGVRDRVKVGEAIARVVQGMEKQFPQIRGKAKMLFETIFNEEMSNVFGEAVDKQAYYYNLFLNRLKKDHASAFQEVTDDVLENTHTWNSAQIDAINKTAERVKKDLPEASQDAINQILQQLNSTEFKLRIVTEFATTSQDEVEKQFRRDFINAPVTITDQKEREQYEIKSMQKYGTLMKKANESDLEYQKRIRDEKQKQLDISREEQKIINKNKGKTDAASKVVLANAKEQKKAADDWLDAADRVEKWGGYDFTTKKESAAAKKEQKAAETELAKALKEELQLIDKVRSSYKSLTDDGYNRKDAISLATEGLEESVANVNSVLSKYGLKFEVKNFAGITNPREIVDMLQEQVNRLANTAKPAEIQALQLKIKDFKIDAAKFDQKRFADSLNNELGKLNQEYELAVSLDADPEFGSMFADMFKINLNSLPRTVSEYADEYTKLLNKYLSDNKTGIELPHLYLTDDNLHAFEKMVKEEKLNAKVYEQIAAAVNNIRQKTRKDIEDTGKEWNSMIEKYGGLQAKLMNISKSSSMELRSIVKKFGSKEQIKAAIDLVDKIRISEDPQEIARLREELNKIINDITSNNTVALKVSDASNRGTDKLTSKAYWDDFKDNDELYAMTFEDMSNVSTRAINLIIDRMEALKDKVKEDPASMKTIVKNIEDAENELIGRDPFGGIVKSIENWISAVREAKIARKELATADLKVSDAEQELGKARQRGNPVDIAVAEQKLTKARDEREKINMKLTKSENKISKSQEKLRKSLQDTADVLGNIQDVFSSVSKLFRAFGDDDTADVIDSICEGFSIMTTLIFGVMAALLLLKTANPELLALAAILSVIVGLFSFLSGQKNKNIDKQVKASENSVKRLENAYKNLEYAVERAYGTAKYGAEQTALANKELQLSELKRQLYLERSRDSKHREEEKIIDLEGQIVDLENEMRKTVEDITNDLLGISGVGDAAEEMVSAMIESFKNGEDWMGKFDDTFSDMIDNMIMKAIVGRVIGDRIQGIFDLVDQKIKDRGYDEQRTLLSLQGRQKEVEERISNLKTSAAAVGRESTPFVSVYERELADIKRQIADAEKAYEDAVRVTPSDVEEIRSITNGFRDNVKNEFQAYMDMFGITFGQDADTSKLSSLQAGIQGVTEETASALEAYMNSVSQQVYLHSELLTEIRDAIIGSDSDIGIGVQAQMLLQLQQSHQIQEAIHNILNGALTPSGRAFMVELSA